MWLFVGSLTRHIHRSEAAGYTCPHPLCSEQDATLTHVFITCPLAATVWGWFAATWAAVTGEDPPTLSADLLLPDDQRTWQPASRLGPLWHRLRLATICQLSVSYQRARHQQDTAETAGVVAARILSSWGRPSLVTGDLPPSMSGPHRACSATGCAGATRS